LLGICREHKNKKTQKVEKVFHMPDIVK